MEGQQIILTTLNPVTEVLKITSSFSRVSKNELPIYLSPLMTIEDLKQYLSDELTSIVEIQSVDELILWSPSANIELDHPSKIYTPDKSITEFSRSSTIIDTEIFERGPIYVSGQITYVGGAYKETEYSRWFRQANNVLVVTQVEYSNVFRSNFEATDYYRIRKIIPNYLCTLFLRYNNQIIMTGDIIPLVIPTGTFSIEVKKKIGNILVDLLSITEKKITVYDDTFFEKFIIDMIRESSSYIIPERYFNSVKFVIETTSNLLINYSNEESIYKFFKYMETWDADNILQTKDKSITIFVSRQALKMRSNKPKHYLASHIARIIISYSLIKDINDDELRFGKIKGIYWSRICQNVGSDIRKPIKIFSEGVTNSNRQVILNGDAYECLENSKNPYIGFLTKPYELASVCLPCCYQTDQSNKRLYEKCTQEGIISSGIQSYYSLFIIDSGRYIGFNRLAFLDDVSDEYLNANKPIAMQNKLLVSAENYYFVTGNNYAEFNTNNLDNLIDLLNKETQTVVLYNNTFHYSMYFDHSKDVTIKYISKNFIYYIVCISKVQTEDMLTVLSEYPAEPFMKKLTKGNIVSDLSVRLDNMLFVGDVIESESGLVCKSNQSSSIQMTEKLNSVLLGMTLQTSPNISDKTQSVADV